MYHVLPASYSGYTVYFGSLNCQKKKRQGEPIFMSYIFENKSACMKQAHSWPMFESAM